MVNRRGIPNLRHGILPLFDWVIAPVVDKNGNQIGDKTLTEWIQGGTGDKVNLDKDLDAISLGNDAVRKWLKLLY